MLIGGKTRNRSFSLKEYKITKYINSPRQGPPDDYADVSFEISEVDSRFNPLMPGGNKKFTHT